MSDDFSAQERELLAALQAADSPSAEAQFRVKQRTFAQLGLGVVAASSAALGSGVAKAAVEAGAANPHAASSLNAAAETAKTTGAAVTKLTAATGLKLGLGVAGVLIAGAGVFYAVQSATQAPGASVSPVDQNSVVQTVSAVIPQAVVPALSRRELSPEPDVSQSALEPTANATGRGSNAAVSNAAVSNAVGKSALQRETELLSQAHQAIGAGRAREALKLLGEHQKQFPRGTLRIERQAAFALARCLAGETSRGRSEAESFRKQHPNSPMNQRLADACGLQSAPRSSNKPR